MSARSCIMSGSSCIRGEPEIVFSFDDDDDDKGEIVFNIGPIIVNGWRLKPFQTPCKVIICTLNIKITISF